MGRSHIRLSFPQSGIGRIYVRAFDTNENWLEKSVAIDWHDWSLLANAKGQVNIPRDVVVMLVISLHSVGTLEFLKDLPKGSIDILQIFAPHIRAEDLKALEMAAGLRGLVLMSGSMSNNALSEVHLPDDLTLLGISIGHPTHLQLVNANCHNLHIIRFRNVFLDVHHEVLFNSLKSIYIKYDFSCDDQIGKPLSWLKTAKNARRLYLYSPMRIHDHDWPELESLEHLTLRDASIELSSILTSSKLPRLSSLNLDGVDSGTNTIFALAKLPYLQNFALDGGRLDSNELSVICRMIQLESLSLRNMEIFGSIEALAEARYLKYLNLSGTIFDPNVSMQLPFESLTHLDLSNTSADSHFLNSLSCNGGLISLKLQGCSQINRNAIEAIGLHTGLEDLDLSETSVARSLAKISPMPSLERLLLCELDIEAGDLSFAGTSSLKELVLERSRLGPGVLTAMGRFSTLRYLDLYEATVPSAELAELRNLTKLKELTLPSAIAPPTWIESLPELAVLALEKVSLDDTSWMHFRSLEKLSVHNGTVSLECVGKKDNLGPSVLEFRHVKFNDAVRTLGQLRTNLKLKQLDISFCGLDSSALTLLRDHPTLRTLVMYDVTPMPNATELLQSFSSLDSISGWMLNLKERAHVKFWNQIPWCWSVYPVHGP